MRQARAPSEENYDPSPVKLLPLERSEESKSQRKKKAKKKVKLKLLKSIYEGRPHTVFFPYHEVCGKTRDTSRVIVPSAHGIKVPKMYFRLPAYNTYKCVRHAFLGAGFIKSRNDTFWNGYWGRLKKGKMTEFVTTSMNPYQKFNHFSGCWQAGRKDNLYKHIKNQQKDFPRHFNFLPKTYFLKTEL